MSLAGESDNLAGPIVVNFQHGKLYYVRGSSVRQAPLHPVKSFRSCRVVADRFWKHMMPAS